MWLSYKSWAAGVGLSAKPGAVTHGEAMYPQGLPRPSLFSIKFKDPREESRSMSVVRDVLSFFV